MPLRDHTGRLMYDSCASTQRLRDNREIFEYLLLDHRHDKPCTGGEYGTWNGFGLDLSVVDGDSEIRAARLTHHKERTQMNVRTFVAAPNLGVGVHMPATESRLIQGAQVTTDARNCRSVESNVVERDFDRFDPCLLDHPVSVDNVVPVWTRGGASSRHISLSDDFQRRMLSLRSREASRRTPVFAASDVHAASVTPADPNQTAAQRSSRYSKLRDAVNV